MCLRNQVLLLVVWVQLFYYSIEVRPLEAMQVEKQNFNSNNTSAIDGKFKKQVMQQEQRNGSGDKNVTVPYSTSENVSQADRNNTSPEQSQNNTTQATNDTNINIDDVNIAKNANSTNTTIQTLQQIFYFDGYDDYDMDSFFEGQLFRNYLQSSVNQNGSQINSTNAYRDLYDDNYMDLFDEYYEYYGDYAFYMSYQNNKNQTDFKTDYSNAQDYFANNDDICYKNDKGQVVLNSSISVCDVELKGADVYTNALEGGIDGVYNVVGCHNNRPKYVRLDQKGQERVLWWSSVFGDWDINTGSEPDVMHIICFGGDNLGEERPNFVNPTSWALARDVYTEKQDQNTSQPTDLFKYIRLNITCTDGQVLKNDELYLMGRNPLLTDSEMEMQYRMIFQRYQGQKMPQYSTLFVLVVVFSGIGIVLCIPVMNMRRAANKHSARSFPPNYTASIRRKERQGKL
eukprot:TRINITY_DN727_c1_g2_i2.p1 TRINITY_DN727_c1_g2~~TRINITY_DN727_c1_g2_i2.p1  ORF type:complete len:457 (+),score=33.01 TRINITY_DN727_c1_g2_i2:163-1533(+)